MTQPLIKFFDIAAPTELVALCQNQFAQVVIVSDHTVASHYAVSLSQSLQAKVICIEPGEQSKTREIKAYIEDQLFKLGCGRDTCLLALGGGVVTDLVGFVAATYMRGVPVIYLPTTLLAMIDAAIGGKTAINTDYAKNSIGTFTQPSAIFVDVNTLATLPDSEFRAALPEAIKHGLVSDAGYFNFIESNLAAIIDRDPLLLKQLIETSSLIKSAIVIQDVQEKNKREVLNLGHTVAHAIESASDYTIKHGEAVALGLIAEARLSHTMGLLASDDLQRIESLLARVIDLSLLAIPARQTLLSALSFDKKTRNKKIRVVLLRELGEVVCQQNRYAQALTGTQLEKLLDGLYVLKRKESVALL